VDRGFVRRWSGLVVGAVLATAGLSGLAGCSSADGPPILRLGYFPNLTHATPIVGVQKGFFAQELGSDVKVETSTFNAGPAAVQALFSGAVDAVYLGPGPTLNAWQQSKGKALTVVAGAASGGAFLVTRPGITSPEQLRGKKLATPQLGNTQDVALRYWLKEHGLKTTRDGGGDVQVLPQDNAQTVTAFVSGAIDGAWVPEPYATRLRAAGGRVLVDERDLWPGGTFVVTNLVVSQKFLAGHRDLVKKLITGQVAANEFINAHPDEAQKVVSEGIGKLAGKPLDLTQTAQAWTSLRFLDDPVGSSLRECARHAHEVGLLDAVNLDGLYDLSLLNEVLTARGQPAVAA